MPSRMLVLCYASRAFRMSFWVLCGMSLRLGPLHFGSRVEGVEDGAIL